MEEAKGERNVKKEEADEKRKGMKRQHNTERKMKEERR